MKIVLAGSRSLLQLGLVFALLLTLSAPLLRAHGDDDHEEDSGSEGRHTTINLVPTQFAPAGASGIAELEAESEHGVVTGKLELEVHGLIAGDYTVVVWDRAFSNSVVLGALHVSDSGAMIPGTGPMTAKPKTRSPLCFNRCRCRHGPDQEWKR